MKKVLQKTSLADQAYQVIKNAILNRELPPGTPLIESEMAKQLSVSRNVIQRVFVRMLEEKLVEKRENNRVFVKEYTKEDIIEMWEVREMLEMLAVRKAAEKRTKGDVKKLYSLFQEFSVADFQDDNQDKKKNLSLYEQRDREFHREIARISSNSLLQEILSQFSVQVNSFNAGLFRYPQETLLEHKQLIQLIEEQDSHGAEEMMKIHMGKTLQVIKDQIKE